MSQARGNGQNGGNFYSNITQPVKIDLQFTVAAADAGGLGVKSIKSNGYIERVFMHTSQTPGVVSGVTNPNPASGFAWIQLKSNYNVFLGELSSIQSPNTGSIKIDNGATLTLGNVYIISTLGNATAAQWTTVGVPAGVTPAVGVSFVAIATGAGSGNTSTSRVSSPSLSGVQCIEVVGNPNVSIANSNIAANAGAWVLVQFLGATNSSTTTLIPVAPADNSVVSLSLYFDRSSVSIDGL